MANVVPYIEGNVAVTTSAYPAGNLLLGRWYIDQGYTSAGTFYYSTGRSYNATLSTCLVGINVYNRFYLSLYKIADIVKGDDYNSTASLGVKYNPDDANDGNVQSYDIFLKSVGSPDYTVFNFQWNLAGVWQSAYDSSLFTSTRPDISSLWVSLPVYL